MLHKIHMMMSPGQEVTDLRTETKKIGDALKNGKGDYILTTNNYSYNYESNRQYINDGGGDMFDGANFTSPVSSSTRSTSSPSTSNSLSGHPDAIRYDYDTGTGSGFTDGDFVHPNISSFTYIAGGWTNGGNAGTNGALVVAGTTGNSGYQWCGWMVGGNSGADGNGSKTQVDIYNGAKVSGFTVYSSYMSTSGASDPSCNSLYILLGHDKWGTTFGTINKYNEGTTNYFNSAMWSESTSQNNVLAIYLLVARQAGNLPVQSEMQDIVDEIIADIKAEFGY